MSARNDVKNVSLKRAYEPPTRSDGTRILIDRLWPRGIKKDVAKIDEGRRRELEAHLVAARTINRPVRSSELEKL